MVGRVVGQPDLTNLINSVTMEIEKQGMEKEVMVRATGCHGFCEQGPIVVVEPDETFIATFRLMMHRRLLKGPFAGVS